MSIVILYWSVVLTQLCLGIALLCATYRLIVGPRAQDRILGLDTLYTTMMMIFVTFGIRTGSVIYFESALAIALLGFVSSVALAKFLMRGEVIE